MKITTIFKVGNSFVVSLPRPYLANHQILVGDYVIVKDTEKGILVSKLALPEEVK